MPKQCDSQITALIPKRGKAIERVGMSFHADELAALNAMLNRAERVADLVVLSRSSEYRSARQKLVRSEKTARAKVK